MCVGETAYITSHNLILTTTAVHLDRCTPIVSVEESLAGEGEYRNGMDGDLIKITRTGLGLTEEDFILDFSEHEGIFEIESTGMGFRAKNDFCTCIAFTGFNLTLVEQDHSFDDASTDYTKLSDEELEELKNNALFDEDYILVDDILKVLESRKSAGGV